MTEKRPHIVLIPNIAVRRSYRAPGAAQRRDDEYLALRERVLIRDKHTCLGCGLPFPKDDKGQIPGLDVHHYNGNPKDNRLENLVSLCSLCHAVFHVGIFARRFGKGMKLIFCPEIAQEDLNLLSWSLAILFAMPTGHESAKACRKNAQAILEALLARSRFPMDYLPQKKATALLNARLAEESSIAFFASLLGGLRRQNPLAYGKRKEWFGGLRLFFDPRKPELFCDRKGNPILPRLLKDPAWQEGSRWAESWLAIGRQFVT